MSALTDHLDHFARWFFNSSPTTARIEVNQTGVAARATRRHADPPPVPHRHLARRSRSIHEERARA